MPTFTDKWVKTADEHEENWRAWTGDIVAHAILEIGSFEGRSALLWHKIHPEGVITCVDPFGGENYGDSYEATFDENTKDLPLIKSRGLSEEVLPLLSAGYDVVYIDGDHHADAARRDGELAWPLLRVGGIMIFDDYELESLPDHKPGPGIDAFLESIKGKFELIAKGWQIAIRKDA